jgi:hypothetical protein
MLQDSTQLDRLAGFALVEQPDTWDRADRQQAAYGHGPSLVDELIKRKPDASKATRDVQATPQFNLLLVSACATPYNT